MVVKIDSVPAEISKSAVATMIESLGIDPKDLLWLEIKPGAIEAEIYARSANGFRFVIGSSGNKQVATHTLTIKIV